MLKLSVSQIIQFIQNEKRFTAVAQDYSFTISIKDYVPYACAAIHNGHQFRKTLWEPCTHSTFERWYEEDPCTKTMLGNQPIVLAGRDSRFEYDLNRAPENAIYTDAWGKTLWKYPLSEESKAKSLQKHENFYKVAHALLHKLNSKYQKVLVFDMHSYNWKRWEKPVPTWNLGIENIDKNRFSEVALSWSAKLGQIALPNNLKSTSRINDTFQGNGYFLKYLTKNFKNTLVLATEIAKVYCDEETGVIFPEVVHAVQTQLQDLIPLQAKEFQTSTC